MLTFTNPDIETTALNRRESLIKHLQRPLLAPTSADIDVFSPGERDAFEVVPPGTDVGVSDVGYVPAALLDPALRRRRVGARSAA